MAQNGRDLGVVVVGGANRDLLVRAVRLPAAGETLEGDLFQEAPGGKGANQAVAAARLGARVAFVGRVGAEPHGEELVERLRREGVDVSHVVRDPGAETGVALVHLDRRGRKSILVHPGANSRMTVEDVRAAGGTIERAAVVLAQIEVPLGCVEEAFRIARSAGARVLLDPAAARRLPQRLLRLVDLVRTNASEAEAITGIAVRGRRSAATAAQVLLRRGAREVAIEAGDEGNLVLTSDEEIWLERLPVKSVDATGAGDAFVAALAVAFAERLPLAQAALLANAASAFATTRVGAQAGLPTRADLRELLEREPQPEDLVLDGLSPRAGA